MLAEGLFENDISSYRYDKRGIGNSIGKIKSGDEVKFSDFINDAISIINHFRGTNKFKKVWDGIKKVNFSDSEDNENPVMNDGCINTKRTTKICDFFIQRE